ncbi:MAG: hypothetical protein ACTSRI_00865, partial [Promethearchaeota archaeon]
ELISKDEEFDISDFKVVADHIYANRLTEYILASIRRENITPEQLLENFEKGLELGRLYYQGFADFFYNELGKNIAKKYLKKLIETKNIEILNEYLTLTPKGIKQFYKAKAEEFKFRSKMVYQGKRFRKSQLYCLLFIIALILLVFYANDINIWLNNF